MYRTCLFCHADLGANEVIERFPVGRRLAFDAHRGRLWVVCRSCARWNLTPLEERWEAIEECERMFRDTKLRMSTDQIGLARVREGLELVRIGNALRPELAAWRYGDQFGRRRRRYIAWSAAGIAAIGAAYAAPLMFGVVAGLGSVGSLTNSLFQLYYHKRTCLRIRLPDESSPVGLREAQLLETTIWPTSNGWMLRFPYQQGKLTKRVTLVGDEAMRAARILLPSLNRGGGSARRVQEAVGRLEASRDGNDLLRLSIDSVRVRRISGAALVATLPVDARLALEMAVHEDTERRALEGELAELENAWREAEEIATIADQMFLPDDLDRRVREIRGG